MKASELFSGSGVEVGQVIPIAGGGLPVHSVNGKSYLVTGTLATIASYPLLETTHLGLCVAMPTATKRATASNFGHLGVVYAGTSYYMCSNSETIKQSTDTTTWNAITGATVIASPVDLVKFGAFAVWADSAAVNGGYISGSVATAIPSSNASTAIAVNSTETLGVMLRSATDCLTATAANGAWTVRVSTMTSPVTQHIRWSQAGNRFIKLATDGKAFTNTDGFTDSDRGVIPGITAIAPLAAALAFKSRHSAATASATVFGVMATPTGGTSTAHIIRTTDGVNFTATALNTLLDSRCNFGAAPSVININEVLYLYSSPKSYTFGGYILKSTDHGATWTKCPIPSQPTWAASYSVHTLTYANGIIFGALQAGANDVVSSYAAGMPATHVGCVKAEDMPVASSYVAGTSLQVPLYVRVK